MEQLVDYSIVHWNVTYTLDIVISCEQTIGQTPYMSGQIHLLTTKYLWPNDLSIYILKTKVLKMIYKYSSEHLFLSRHTCENYFFILFFALDFFPQNINNNFPFWRRNMWMPFLIEIHKTAAIFSVFYCQIIKGH